MLFKTRLGSRSNARRISKNICKILCKMILDREISREIGSYKAENKLINETIESFQPNLFVSLRCLTGHTDGGKAHLFQRSSADGYTKRENVVRYFAGLLRRNLGLKQSFMFLGWHEFGSRKADAPLKNGGHAHAAFKIPASVIEAIGVDGLLEKVRGTVDQIKKRKDKQHGQCRWLDVAFTKGNNGRSILIESVDAVATYASKWEGLHEDGSAPFKSPFASDWDAIEREKSRAVH